MKFIYLADTHIGGSDSMSHRKQPRHLNHFHEIMKCLGSYIKESGDIDFIIHGGNMIDKTTQKSIDKSVKEFNQLPCPTYLALGNHDLTALNSIEMWLKHSPNFFPDGKTDFRLIKDGVQVDVLVCNWCEIPAYWSPEKSQPPWLSSRQLERIADIEADCHTQILVIHSPVYGIPPEQHDGLEPLHAPLGDLCKKNLPVLNNVSLVFGAHNHMNMALLRGECYYVTTAALSEMPFEFKLIEASREKLSMQTVGLSSLVSFRRKYDFESTYVQGRTCDRNFERKLSCK